MLWYPRVLYDQDPSVDYDIAFNVFLNIHVQRIYILLPTVTSMASDLFNDALCQEWRKKHVQSIWLDNEPCRHIVDTVSEQRWK